MADLTSPGAEFYYERLVRAKAVPEAQRSADVRLWLRCHDELEAAFALLPRIQPGTILTKPAGGKPALAAVLRVLAASECDVHQNVCHPKFNLGRLGPQLPPLMAVQAPQWTSTVLPNLRRMLSTGRLPSGHQQLDIVARALLLTSLNMQFPHGDSENPHLDVLQSIRHALIDQSSAAELSRQLAELEEECGSLPSLEQLQAVWLLRAEHHGTVIKGHGPTAVEEPLCMEAMCTPTLSREAVRSLLMLQPNNPRSHYMEGRAAMINKNISKALSYQSRGLELARQQGSDFWIARCGWQVAVFGTMLMGPAVSPLQALQLFDEGDDAFQRCKRFVPSSWVDTLKLEREGCAPPRAMAQQQLQRSPACWQDDILEDLLPEQVHLLMQAAQRVDRFVQASTVCAGCGQKSTDLKQCAACRTVGYCSRACQVAAWPSHKAVCKAARRVAAGS